ncbi:MAG TPA: 30S ribosomal protein S6 [Bacteroidota bacterium]|nr:30S ribosomal protein S6 [Bacteroidota bacterium]
MGTVQRIYESTFIINASLDDAQVDAVIGRVQDLIVKNGGTISALNKWGRKRLSYSINKKTNGFYVNLEFTAPGTLLAVLDRSFQLDEMILRFLTVQLDRKALAARAKAQAEAAAPPESQPAVPVPTREPLFKESAGEAKS